jgi:mRNA interferase HigB
MVVISKAVLKEFAEKHPDAETALFKWYNETRTADWRSFRVRTVFILFIETHKDYDKIDASKIELKK